MMTSSPSRPGLAARLVAPLAAVLLTAGCFGDPADPTSPRRNADPPRLPATSPPAPLPTGSTLTSVAQFEANPCAVATAPELGAAIADPYNLLAANTLAQSAEPSTVIGSEGSAEAVGCGYSFVAPNDGSEAYHEVVVRITRWSSGGPALMAACHTAVQANPIKYQAVNLADEACLGPNAVLPLRSGDLYYTVVVTVKPVAASTPDEDVSVGAITLAAARVLATRLPKQ